MFIQYLKIKTFRSLENLIINIIRRIIKLRIVVSLTYIKIINWNKRKI